MKEIYQVKKLQEGLSIYVQVPGSKSITNRALLLAALSDKCCILEGVLLSDDSRAFLESLTQLGFRVEINEQTKIVVLQGTGGKIPNPHATINVNSAGTAARFLTVFLALAGGEYEIEASSQMCKRPMKPLIDILKRAGVTFKFHKEEDHFPFGMKSYHPKLQEVTVDTGVSSQFASALLMSGVLCKDGLTIHMEGDRAEGSYIKMTLAMMKQFGIQTCCIDTEKSNCAEIIYHVPGNTHFGLDNYVIEPDLSGACYFYAMAPLLKAKVTVQNVHWNSLQGDIQFLKLLQKMDCEMSEDAGEITISGKNLKGFPGIDISMKDFSDQAMTLCAIAPFATSQTLIRNVGHIRYQECNRMEAILTELSKMGITCEEALEVDGIRIYPGTVHQTLVETYEDHRMAMSFTLTGLKTGNITISNPDCCRKTFENYFELIEGLYGSKELS